MADKASNKLLEHLLEKFHSIGELKNLCLDYNEAFLTFLLEQSPLKEEFKSTFFVKVGSASVFRQGEFLAFLDSKILDSSFTSYANKIGLATKTREFLKTQSEVVLNFPYKDCILKGNKYKDDKAKEKEIFFNEILAKNEIDVLFEPKVLYNFELITQSHNHTITQSHNHTITQSHNHTITQSHNHTITHAA